MRFIRKLAEPYELKAWKQQQTQNSPQNLCYGNLPGEINKTVKAQLLEEQGYLCAYTMRRLNGLGDCHIEHVLAQNAIPERDLDYQNMAACFPHNGGDTSHGFGAPIKGRANVTLNEDFVSPPQLRTTLPL
jgi:uncharacterized protein (TIGR02646 family)